MPSISLKETVGCTKKFQVEIEPERLEEQMKLTVRDVKKEVQIPGFRKGRAPEAMLLRRFGPTIRQEAIRDLIPKVLADLFETEGVKPVNDPDIEDLDSGDGGPITFTVSVEEIPAIDISGIEGLRVTKRVREVTDAIVDAEIDRFRQMYAHQEKVDREIRMGDYITANLQKLDTSGVPIIGDKMENHLIVLNGEDTPSPEFDEQIIGMKAGDTKTVRFSYDDSINNPDLVGQTEAYEVEILSVEESIIPELDDDFVKRLGGFDDVESLRIETRKRLERQYESASVNALQSEIIDEFVKQEPFEVPSSMVERVMQSELARVRRSNPEARIDESAFRSSVRPTAVRAVQTFIIMDAIKKQKNIEVTKEDADEHLEKSAAQYGMDAKEFRRRLIKEGHFDDFKGDIANDKAYEWMTGAADVTVETITDEPKSPSSIITPGM